MFHGTHFAKKISKYVSATLGTETKSKTNSSDEWTVIIVLRNR